MNPFSLPRPRTEGKSSERGHHSTGEGRPGRWGHFNKRESFFSIRRDKKPSKEGMQTNKHQEQKRTGSALGTCAGGKSQRQEPRRRHGRAAGSLLRVLPSLKAGVSVKINMCPNRIILRIILIRVLKPSNMEYFHGRFEPLSS